MINYYLLTKPGILLGNLVTVTAGFLLASKGHLHFGLFLATLLGIAFIIASACVFNNYIDRQVDSKMKRTKQRPLVTGLITGKHALIFGTILGILGGATLLLFTNFLTFLIAAVGFFVYVVIYSMWKGRTIYGTAIGSIAGAVPPVVGYCAVSNQLDAGAWILFAMMILWQMPHFFAIAMYHYDDYFAAKIPVLPIVKGMMRTKIHMFLYILAFMITSSLLTLFHYTGMLYLGSALFVGLIWLGLCLQGFRKQENDRLWGQKMFRFSLILIAIISFAIPFDVIK